MLRSHTPLNNFVHITCAVLFGVGLAYLVWSPIKTTSLVFLTEVGKFTSQALSHKTVVYQKINSELNQSAATIASDYPRSYLEIENVAVPTEGKFISANLSTLTVTLYQDGQIVETLPISTIGKAGTPWETPRGLYRIQVKEKNHFSSIGQVYMPYSLQFNGNYFIHGWTYYPDGTLVSATYSGGCIKLETALAKKIYDFADIGTPVYVFSNTKAVEANWGNYVKKDNVAIPNISATSYLIADIDTGEILAENNRLAILPISSLSRLISSLVTLDAINFFNHTSVKTSGHSQFPSSTLLLPNEKIVVKDLLYPMIFGDNGLAAETLADIMGRSVFVSKMNSRAEAIGLTQTVLADPAGILPDNKSSATDLYKLLRHIYIFKNYLIGLSGESQKTVGQHFWRNQNNLTDLPGFIGGISTGSASSTKSALALISFPVSATTTRSVAVIVLDSKNLSEDMKNLADYTRAGFTYQSSIPQIDKSDLKLVDNPNASSSKISLAFVGDIMLDRGVKQSILKNGLGDYHYPFADLSRIKKVDITFANLEGPVSDRGANLGGIYSFRMNPSAVTALVDEGFDVLSVANNHMGDWNRDAFTDTLNQFSDTNILLVGGGKNKQEVETPKIVTKAGIKIGYLAFSDVGPDWLAATSSGAGILLARDPQAPQIIQQASQQCDILVVSYHFGNEYEHQSNWRQRELAHLAIDNGARIVVGHHPHTPQETESYRGGVIMYSLGNFVFDQYFSTSTMSGLAVKITLDKDNIYQVEEFKTSLDKQFRVTVN